MSGIAYGLVGDSVKQALLEAETSVNTYAPPDLIKHSPGVAKTWCQWSQIGTQAKRVSHGTLSVTDAGVGLTDVTWSTAFSTADYAIVLQGRLNCATDQATPTTTVVRANFRDNASTNEDTNFCHIAAWGDQ